MINKRTLSLSKEKVSKLQQKRFIKLIQFVAQHSLYYQKIIKKYNIDINNCIPEDFPILTKKQLIENFDDIVTDKRITRAKIAKFLEHSNDPQELFLNKYYVIHTSGSSGIIGYYVYTPQEFIQGVSLSSRIAGVKMLQKLAYIGASRGHFAGITMITTAKKLPFLYKEVQTFDINQPFSAIISELNAMQPTIVSGYAFALKKLAEAQKKGSLSIKPFILQSGGEPLSTEDKKYIQNAFNVPVANVYASSEHLLMGIGRDSFDGMYLMEDNLYFEIKHNEMYVTNLYNYTLPLIRYHMSDYLEITEDTIKLTPFTKVKEIVGRNEYVPTFLNDNGEEDFISPILLVEFYVQHLTKFQLHLVDKQSFIFKACLEANLKTEIKEKTITNIKQALQKILQEKMMNNVKYNIEIVNDLWVDPKTGKFRLITQ